MPEHRENVGPEGGEDLPLDDELNLADWPPGKGRVAELTHQAITFMFRGQYDTAWAMLQQALKEDAAYPRTHTALAYTLMYQGKPEEGEAAAARALELDPRFAIGYTARGDCRARRGDVAGAVADYEAALTLDPANYRVYYNFACFWCDQGDEERCRRNLEIALNLSPAFFPEIVRRDPSLAAVAGAPWFSALVAAARAKKKPSPGP